jgi:NAD(P)-dependent dehydrogenase (short-subunit alcohol dehydrogenase family)
VPASRSDAPLPGSLAASEVREEAASRIAVVTGASAGIGLYTALGLARTGMRVVMTGRDPARTEAARRFVIDRASGAQVETALAEFASLAEVRRLAGEILSRHDRLDLLVNNAGLFSPKFERSADGYEMTFAVNHLAPFLLTNLLLDRLKASAPARIVTVASRAHHGARIHLATITGPRDWSMLKAYNRSKLCNILFTRELAARLRGSGVVATSLHPGVVATTLAQRGGIVDFVWRLAKPFMISAEKGAETSVFLATVPDPAPFHGGYVVRKALARPDPVALDADLARRLWAESARLVGL